MIGVGLMSRSLLLALIVHCMSLGSSEPRVRLNGYVSVWFGHDAAAASPLPRNIHAC